MIFQTEYNTPNLGDVTVTYYGPLSTYTQTVASTFDFSTGDDDVQPGPIVLAFAMNSLVWYAAQDGGHFREDDEGYWWANLPTRKDVAL